jgi:hypothetical protein
MKKLISSLLLYSLMTMAHGQLAGVYVADFTKKVEYYLRFSNDGQYYIDIIEHLTNDILDKRTMSIGYYIVDGKMVNLKDKVHNFQMQLNIDNDSLKMIDSFYLLKGKSFGFRSTYVDAFTLDWLKNFDSISVEKDRAKYKIKNYKLFPLANGIYLSNKCVQCEFEYRLMINKDSTYNLYFKDLLISEGTWKRKGVELILYDTSLKHQFHLMIGHRVLISKLLLGDYESTVLQKK